MKITYQCPGCGRMVASTGPVYGTPEQSYVYLRPHNVGPGEPCGTYSVTVARKLRRRSA